MTRLNKLPNARAELLLGRLDERYREFARTLPPRLMERALLYGTFAGRPSGESLRGPSGLNAVIACTPWLFWESFSGLDDDLLLQTAEAGALFGLASVLVDHLIDRQVWSTGEATLLHQALYAAGVAGYRKLFPASSSFWTEFDRLAHEHLVGMALEVEGRADPDILTPDAFETLASARIAPMIAVVAALVELTGDHGLLVPVETSMKAVIVAGQLVDDIGDWKEDLQAERITYYLAQLLPARSGQVVSKPPEGQVREIIDADWRDIDGLRTVMEWLDKGLAAVEDMDCPAWVAYIEEYQALTQQLLTASVGRHLARSLSPLSQVHSDSSPST